jgi:hypothetical protein
MSESKSEKSYVRCEDRTGKRGTFGWYKREIEIIEGETRTTHLWHHSAVYNIPQLLSQNSGRPSLASSL